MYQKKNIILKAAAVNIGPTVAGGSGTTHAASFSTDAVSLECSTNYCISFDWEGSATGTFKLQGSNDMESGSAPSPTSWRDISGSSEALAVGTCYMTNVTGAAYQWVRLVYTRTAGTISDARCYGVLVLST